MKKPSIIDIASAHETTDDLVGFMERHGLVPELQSGSSQAIQPVTTEDRSKNKLRPVTWDDIIGQEFVKAFLQPMVEVSKRTREPLDHTLFVGASGTGKTTFAHVLAHELGVRVFQLEAPVSHDMLLELREAMSDGDILFVDEIHQQAIAERRGRSASTQPEVLFGVMEDFTLTTVHGVLPFPHITVIGGTTDEGALPDAFVNRFPNRPPLSKYTTDEMALIAARGAPKLNRAIGPEAAKIFARASRGVPREVNNFLRNAAKRSTGRISPQLASEVLRLNNVTTDGLNQDMQRMLVFLYTRARHVTKGTGEVTHQASVSTIATAIGKSRDQKAIALRVEPYLIEKGYVQVGHGGRRLTDAGIERARQLRQEGVNI
jgi:Holliday junction DNA helicase RuvB